MAVFKPHNIPAAKGLGRAPQIRPNLLRSPGAARQSRLRMPRGMAPKFGIKMQPSGLRPKHQKLFGTSTAAQKALGAGPTSLKALYRGGGAL